MAKLSLRYVCNECGAAQSKWMGRCPDCGRWHTLIEEVTEGGSGAAKGTLSPSRPAPKLYDIEDVDLAQRPRRSTGLPELDRVLGGGLVPGALVLVGGDPGIGKSTLLLQAGAEMSKAGARILYASGEESLEQVALRAKRPPSRSMAMNHSAHSPATSVPTRPERIVYRIHSPVPVRGSVAET
jgi:DNA repair protein RadA/Sms